MDILVVGSGGREHALAWHLARTGHTVTVSPGNAGIAQQIRCEPPPRDGVQGFVDVAHKVGAELVVVGPEQPLVDGLVDALAHAGIAAFGPTQSAARLEGSKAFMKEVARAAGVHTADFVAVTSAEDARAFLEARIHSGKGAVIKADGLCAGKGVVVLKDAREGLAVVQDFLAGRFGDASKTVVVEDLLEGDEVSLFALCDGEDALMFSGARDHKRLKDGDEGPNTGGMGAVAPLEGALMGDALRARTLEEIVRPTLREMKRRGAPFRGILFCGLMVKHGAPQLLEFNVRFGDPETEALLLGMPMDLAPALHAVARGERLPAGLELRAQRKSAVVVVAAEGYPDAPKKGAVISGLDEANAVHNARVFCAGVAAHGDALVASGGRVLVVGGQGESFAEALDVAYAAVAKIRMPGMQFRSDIGNSVR
jgi:phosphoribosylamine---glycine ligase